VPRATANIEDVERLELKSCPGGYVVLRRMTYGQNQKRQAMAMEMSAQMQGKQGMNVDIDMNQEKVTAFEFASCIVEHNLEDDNEQALDFKIAAHVGLLDVRVGQEIGDKIDQMNRVEEEAGN
jgi:hypothetical protein